MRDHFLFATFLTCCLLATPLSAQDANERNWAQWRGPLATGEAPHADPPIEWNDENNIRWKVALPGRGHSTPIVWGDRIFVTTAVPFGEKLPPKYSGRPGEHDNHPVTHRYRFAALAIDRADGSIRWEKNLHEDLPVEGAHFTASLASASPVTDGKYVYAFFGSFGLYCLDFDGNLIWKADLGKMHTKHGHGEGSSPVLHGDTLVINWDHEEQSKLIAFDKRTGKERWEVERDEVTSWATPIVVEHDGRAQLIVSGTGRVRGYDLLTGKVIWECGGLSANIVASPVSADGMVFAGSSYEKTAMIAVRLDGAEGDITGSPQVPWTLTTRTPYVPSPLLYEDSLYFLRHYQGILSRVNTKTGEDDGGPFRLGLIRDVYASPVAAAGRIYVTDRLGTTIVMTHNSDPKLLSLNRLDDQINASAALVGSELFLRGEKFLYCIADESQSSE